MLEISVSDTNRAHIVLRGRLDANTSSQLAQHVARLYGDDLKDVQIDMSQCEFISSAGLRVVMTMHKKVRSAGGRLVFRGVTPAVMNVFTITEFDKILTFEP